MTSTIEELMQANLYRVFGERDEDRRSAAAVEIYTDDVVFYDPEGVVSGREAVTAKARELLEGALGFVFTASGPVLQSHDLGYLAWDFGPAGQPAVVSGIDIGTVRGGQLAVLHTLILGS